MIFITMAIAVPAEASLAFLGLGQRPPVPSSGSMLDIAPPFPNRGGRNEMLAFANGKHDDQADALSRLLGWKGAVSM